MGERASRDPIIARFSRIGARIWVGSPFRLSLEGLTGSQEASGAPPRSLGSSCTDGCHYAGTPLFGCRIGVPPKSPLLLVQGSSHASCAMCCVYAPFVFIYSSNVDTTSRFTRTSMLMAHGRPCYRQFYTIVIHNSTPSRKFLYAFESRMIAEYVSSLECSYTLQWTGLGEQTPTHQ